VHGRNNRTLTVNRPANAQPYENLHEQDVLGAVAPVQLTLSSINGRPDDEAGFVTA